MSAICVANGPAFRAGVRLETFDNVDVYSLLARVVGVASRLAGLAYPWQRSRGPTSNTTAWNIWVLPVSNRSRWRVRAASVPAG